MSNFQIQQHSKGARPKTHKPEECTECGMSLEDVVAVGEEEWQVYDIPAIRIEVTAHRAEIKICPGQLQVST